MKPKTRKISSVLIALFLAAGFIYFLNNFNKTEVSQAGAGDNLSGFAWSDMPDGSDEVKNPTGGIVGRGAGWISFNSTNCDANNDGFSDGTPSGCPPAGTPISNYGVHIDPASGNFSGFAWSENIGWISFSPAGPYPQSPSYSAKLDLVTNQVIGWARACAGTVNGDCASADRTDGWDGWIKMSGTATNGSSYGVSRSGCELTGYAWGSDVVGWIKFKGTAQNGSPYGVVSTLCENQPPSAINLAVTQPNYCVSGPAGIFSWTFTDPDGDSQSAYQVQVDNNSNFSSPEDDSGKVISGSNSYATPLGRLTYNTTYYWRVKVWDSRDAVSGWSTGPSFTTPLHGYPEPDFSHSPQNPSVGEIVNFTDTSVCYNASGISYPCKDNPANSYLWDFGDGSTSTARGDTSHSFASIGTYTVRLSITDDIGTCTGQGDSPVGFGPRLPRWREIAPF